MRLASRRLIAGLAGLGLAAGLIVIVASAARDDPGAVPTSSAVAGRVMSPFCPGLTLEECPSDQSAQLRQRIDEKLAARATNREVDRWLVAQYGEAVLARPPQLLSWMAPTGLAAASLVVLLFVIAGRKPDVKDDPLEQEIDEARSRL